ncbi:proprotein convertase P-domain-containing protein [Pseudomarimonas arenosa]|uniref:Proprotein convertase P-domain-containing protein n=1 Tax=Pseudomarimonas arenosa TaxID=2774145 RepID=A0AAW3ZLJ9_9GAMM|nr:proprotein convertase P-domain-containing protein [Pseudomarimonas arenosa]MBD8525547.1 proprotein convertase P-domain-containing protein [Pseudomarimonas arenosa]
MRVAVAPMAAALALAFCSVAQAGPLNSAESAFSLGESVVLPAPDLAKLKMEDAKSVGGAYRYGVQIPVEGMRLGERGFGRWSKAGKNHWKWSVELVAPAARSMDFHFSKLSLPASATLTIRGEGEQNLREISSAEVSGGEFWSPYVAGEKATLEVLVSKQERSQVQLQLGAVTHGYRGLFENADPMQKSGSCNVDTICPTGNNWRDQIDSVGQYTFSQGGSSYVCTGTLLANTGNTTTPYFLTANHCISSQTVASSIVVYWNYQSSTCRTPGSSSSGTPLSKSIATHSQSGSTLRATRSASDFTLLQLSSAVPSGANPYFSGWDRSGTTPSSAVGIHHPQGHEKRISVENQGLSTTAYGGGSGTTHWKVSDWDEGTTEGGSSGSGLWNQNKLIVGQLHGGSAACGNNLADYYGKLSVSWTGGGSNSTRLSNWLDPGSTGATTKAGYRTGSGGGGGGTTYQNTTDYQIRDNTTVESPITISGRSGNASSSTAVAVNIVHTYIGDLKVDLIAPDGSVYVLHNRSGGSADNIVKTYTVNLSGEVANGTWKLRVNDNAGGDIGYINSWSMTF